MIKQVKELKRGMIVFLPQHANWITWTIAEISKVSDITMREDFLYKIIVINNGSRRRNLTNCFFFKDDESIPVLGQSTEA